MAQESLKQQLIRLGAIRPDLRKDIRPIIAAMGKQALVTLDSKYDKASPRELEGATARRIAQIGVERAQKLLKEGTTLKVSKPSGLGVEIVISFGQDAKDAYGYDTERLELRPMGLRAWSLHWGSNTLGEFQKEDTIKSSGERMGNLLASEIRSL